MEKVQNINNTKTKVMGSILLALMLASNMWVSAASADEASILEEIVVTATKLGETPLHDTPLAVSVFTDQYLNDMMVSDVRDLGLMTPGLSLSANANMAQVYIRGIGSNNVFAGADPSSTIHYDGVYLARPQSNFGNFVDVERVEVLRGPQGTLYGRNSVGGTINIISKRPSLDKLTAVGDFTVGNKDFYRAHGYVSIPLVSDVAAMSVSAYKSDRDPFRENISTGNDLDDEDIQSFRGQFLWQVSDATEVIIRGDYYEDNSSLYANSSSPIAPPPGNPPLASSIIGNARKVALNAPALIDRETDGISLEINSELSETWILKSLSAYRRSDNYISQDSDSTEIDTLRTLLWEDQEQISQEFNLVGSFDRTKLFLGAYYMEEQIDSLIEVQVRAAGRSTRLQPEVDTDTWALFGQASFDVSERFTLTAGGRYTEETKDWVKLHGVFLTGTDTQVSSVNLPPERGDYEEFTPKVGAEFRTSEDLMVYATVSRGFKSGGFNITAAVPGGYDPEKLLAYEVGLNARHLDGRLSSRLSAFYYDYEDLQVQAFIVPGVASITNAASAEVSGVEAELFGNLTEDFVLRLNAAYLDATYDSYPVAPLGGGVVIDASGKRLNNAPEWSTSILGEYTTSFDWGLLRFTGEYGWQSRVYFSVANSLIHSQGDYGLANASVGYESPNGMFSLTLWGRNLFDEEYLRGTSSIFTTSGGYGPIRTFGLRMGIRY